MLRAHRIRLYPNNKQATYFSKACGVSRFTYNWGLAEWKRLYEAGEKVNEGILRKRLNAIKREQFPWMLEVSKCAVQAAIRNDLNNAFRNFFRRVKNGETPGYPNFKKKGIRDSFYLSNDQLKVKEGFVWIPKLGWVRLAENLRFAGKVNAATVSKRADKWFISIQVELANKPTLTCENQAVGVDFGVSSLAVLSDGTVIAGSKASRRYAGQLRRLNQELSRRQGAKKGERQSANFKKTRKRLAKLYTRMADLRSDEIHKLTTMLTSRYSLIGIEDLGIREMMGDSRLARHIADAAMAECRRQLEYKAEATGTRIVIADRYYPSSKMCSRCGTVKDSLSLSERVYRCPHCGFECDRDLNAALNLLKNAQSA